ncbi:hypothetical protein [uncultured Dysosmobacter sp.]|uniref:hypothetical protein n=1 Tax=uncultured Dysosmobacter sp. TaxID=2591384 RepID=UPI002612DF4E|nr:hypothetical protein [uncultured Dysosmobacter sp.]
MKKKLLSLALVLVMCMCLGVTAFAAGESPLSRMDDEYNSDTMKFYGTGNHSYTAYSVLIEQTALVNGNFPKNIHGETYGNGLMAIEVGQEPDLMAAIGTDGQKGYVRTSELDSSAVCQTPEEALAWQLSQPDSYYVPLYDFQGNEIGSFYIERSNLTIAEMEAMKK